MILILSHNHYDEPTNHVIDWLLYYDASFKRINGHEFLPKNNFTIILKKNHLKKEHKTTFKNKDVSVVWFRRWLPPANTTTHFEEFVDNSFSNHETLLIESYNNYLKQESTGYNIGIWSLLNEEKFIPKIDAVRKGGYNKIDVLVKANKLGIRVPETIITSSKKELIVFFKKNKAIITKPIYEIAPILYKEHRISMFTKEVTMMDIESFPNIFFPSLFQNKIEKSFEIRVFIYKDKIYSTAIFSQNDKQTKSDFRNYNYLKPNRIVPFNLPTKLKNKLFKLLSEVGLNTGSIDLIMTPKNEIILLEINPVGQFGLVSINGNFPVEKMIAEDLINTDNDYGKHTENC